MMVTIFIYTLELIFFYYISIYNNIKYFRLNKSFLQIFKYKNFSF